MKKASYPREMEVEGYICSYPKSGRTWLRFAFANLLNDCYDLQEDLHLANQFSLLPNDDQSQSQPWKEVAGFAFANRGVPLLAASHALWDQRFQERPLLFLLRDPADVVASRYRHMRFHQARFEGTLSEFVRNDQWGAASLLRYLDSWQPHLDNPKIMLLRYEDLRADPNKHLAAAAEHLGIKASEAQISTALQKSTLDRMKELEQKFGVGEPHNYDRQDYRARRVGRALQGAGRQELGPTDNEYLRSLLFSSPAAWQLVQKYYQ